MAFWPRSTLDCERWTLTHSSGWADVLVEPGLALVLGLELEPVLGLAARWASSEAEIWDDGAAEDEPDDADGDPDGDLDGDVDGELDPEGELDVAAEPDGAGDIGPLVGA